MKSLVIVVMVLVSSLVLNAKGLPKIKITDNEVNNKVAGYVMDKATGELLVGVLVKIEELDQEVYTNFDGKFEFENVKSGEYNISCNMVSYENLQETDVELGGNEITLKLNPVESTFLIK